jgi:cell division septal protein FtsQ
VTVSGANRLDPELVRETAHLHGTNIFRASAHQAEARLALLPAVRRARVAIQLPDRALVEVEERVPAIAVSSTAGALVADEEGLLFALAGGELLPRLEDETRARAAGERLDPALVRATRDIAAREPGFFGHRVQRIRLTGALGLIAVLEGGMEIRIGPAQQVELKLETARQIVLSRAGKRLDYVDVRNRENPVFFPQD